MIPIVIPTYLREHRQIALQGIPPELRQHVILFTHHGQDEHLIRAIEKISDPGVVEVVELGEPDGIADVRALICDVMHLRGHSKIFMLDDGCKLYTSSTDGQTRKVANTPMRGPQAVDQWSMMLSGVEHLLDTYPQVGISPRPGNNRHYESLQIPGRAYSCYGLNLQVLWNMDVRFDGMYEQNKHIRLYEDFWLTLSLLSQGVPNAVWYDYAFQHEHGKAGGNSTIRNNTLQRECLEALRSYFPDYVKLVKRKAVSWNVGEDPFRWECVVSWKKCLQNATNKL